MSDQSYISIKYKGVEHRISNRDLIALINLHDSLSGFIDDVNTISLRLRDAFDEGQANEKVFYHRVGMIREALYRTLRNKPAILPIYTHSVNLHNTLNKITEA